MSDMLQQQADAWLHIAALLDELEPGWIDLPGNGVQCAERAIRDMASTRTMHRVKAAEAILQVIEDFRKKLGRPLEMTDSPRLSIAIAKTILSTNPE